MEKRKIGYAYVESQNFGLTYTPERCLEQGTLFPELDIDVEEYVGETMPD